VQYAQNLFRLFKVLADNTSHRGQIILTGSQSYHLMQDVTESLAGRIAILEMSGLTLREINRVGYHAPFLPTDDLVGKASNIKNTAELWQVIHRGSMPELQNPEIDWDSYYRNYVRTYIERDVRSLIALKDENLFYKFLVSLAARTGQLFNASSVANDIGVSLKTIQNWSSILEASGILRFIQPYYDNIHKRLVKTPKVYFLDTGLVCHLLGWSTPEVLERGAMAGSIFETFVLSEVLKSYLNAGGDQRLLFFYRDIQKREIDLLIKVGNTLFPVEIKKTATPRKDMISSFSALESLNVQIGMGALICLVNSSTYLTKNVITVPVDMI
jgi:predicted AAA+ superfamily ATPase